MKRSTRQFFLLTFFSSLLMTQAFAQVGNIRGKVTDAEGNPIEGVTIRIEGMEVARKYTVDTDAKGEYYHGGVTRQGTYRVIAQKEGYQSAFADGLQATTDRRGQEDAIGALPQQLQSVLGRIDSTVAGLQATLEQAEPDLLATMQTLNQTSESLANIGARLDDWLTEHDNDMQQFIGGGLAKTPALVADTRNTMREMEKLLNKLRENPSQLVYKPQSEAVVVED